MVYLGLPSKNGGSFHGYVSHNQMVALSPSKIFQESEVHSQARREDFQIEINLSEAIVTGNGAMIVPIPGFFWGFHGKSMEFLRQDGHVQTPLRNKKHIKTP